MAWSAFPLCFLLLVSSFGSSSAATKFPFQDPTLSWAARMDDLMKRLTVEEVLEQLANPGYLPTPEIPRLGIGPYNFATECLRGDAYAPGNATAFPQAIGLAASWSRDLMYRVAEATGVEARAKNNYFRQQGNFSLHTSTSCFSPVVNIETYGEDPYLTGEIATSFVHGLQGNDSRYVRASAGCKHLAAYDGPENIPLDRHSFNAQVSERDLRMTFLPAFRTCVEAGTYSIGGSYNAINGVPSAMQRYLMTDILRGEWGFTGYVFSDASAVEDVISRFNLTNNTADVAALVLNAGTNMDLTKNTTVFSALGEALKQTKVSEALLRQRLAPLFYTRMRLGDFDPPEMNPYRSIGMEEVDSPAHKALAVEAAMKSFVLLKNDGLLPLNTSTFDTIGVVGPLANNSQQLLGDYAPRPPPGSIVTPLQGLQPLATTVQFAAGCQRPLCMKYSSDDVKRAVTNTQLNIFVLGTAGSTPAIVLIVSGGPVNLTYLDSNPQISAIIHCFLPAQAAGDAIRHVLLNDVPGAVPAGRSPYTWPKYFGQLQDITDYSMEGRTYRYWKGPSLYPFGYGLSYTRFSYSKLTCDPSVMVGDDVKCSVAVQNVGSYDADEVVQAYIAWTGYNVSFSVPRLQLAWFDRIAIRTSRTVDVSFVIKHRSLALWYDSGWEIKAGTITVYVGGQQPGQEKKAPSNVLSAEVKVMVSA
ncbi:hypothetical protein BaRGS_00008724 [Batillaria attramentaria]|uniref:Fibronectin type III-like domain-containing protein n=1 Tax=Batillaria attramentaria TaxID=370345 RepID=A0ABD0LKW4_9CAEN